MGSDAGVFAHGTNAREIELMVERGMSPAEALRAATITAAEVLGREQDLGRIAPGYLADLLAVRGNPLDTPAALRQPVWVLKEGELRAGAPAPKPD
jgi:imidazolonepropionase-like amidohydrolase